MAARAARDARGRRSGGPGRARRLALDRVPGHAREPHPGAARGVPAARRLRLSLRPDRRDRRQAARTRPASSRSRARREVERGRPRFESEPEQEERLAASFFAAAQEGDLGALETLLAADVELHGDGGGKAPALAHPVRGRARAARTLAAWARAGARFGGFTPEVTRVNGAPGAIFPHRTARSSA